MKKFGIWVLALFCLTAFLNAPASAAVKAGATCSKAGLVNTSGGKKFTCVKSGKKLVWNKGVAVAKPAAIPSAQPSSAASPTPSAPAEKIPVVPTSLENLEANYEGIPYSSWKNSQDNLEKYQTTDLKVTITFGPNSTERYPNKITEDMVKLGSRVMGAQKQPQEVRFVEFNKTDVPWAREIAAKYVSPFNLGISLPDQAEEKCSGADCDGAVTNIASGVGLVLVGISTPVDRFGIVKFKGQNDIHEYVHAVQGMIFASKGGRPPATRTPCWYAEGQPQAISIVTAAKTYSDYIALRKSWVTNNRWLLKDFEADSIEEFMRLGMKVPCPDGTRDLNFSLGYIIMDALVAAGGIDKTFDVQTAIATGLTFEEAFKKVYGLSWAEGSAILARVASRTYKELKK